MDALSPRQRQVLTLAADGMTKDEIGRTLFIMEATVRRHMTDLREKLGARNTAHAVAIAVRRGWIT